MIVIFFYMRKECLILYIYLVSFFIQDIAKQSICKLFKKIYINKKIFDSYRTSYIMRDYYN